MVYFMASEKNTDLFYKVVNIVISKVEATVIKNYLNALLSDLLLKLI